jgi:hypothetical protein
MFLAAWLTACTSDGGEPTSPAPSPNVVRGGTFTFGVYGDVATLDPYSPAATDLTRSLARPIYPVLFGISPSGVTEPELALGARAFDGGARVRLRRAFWSDGRRITPTDVVASWRRATPPSGFASIRRARPAGSDTVVFHGEARNWLRTLSRATFVLPRGRPAAAAGGPFGLKDKTPGFEFVYTPNPRYWGPQPLVDRIRVRLVSNVDTLLRLLKRGSLDAAAVPSTVNIFDRLELAGLRWEAATGWESIVLDLPAQMDRAAARAVWGALGRSSLERGLIRNVGRVSDTLRPGPGTKGAAGPFERLHAARVPAGAALRLAAPLGDELLELLQRAVYQRLSRVGFDVELIGFQPLDLLAPGRAVVLERRAGAPGLADPPEVLRKLPALPLFHVATVVVVAERVHNVQANPSLEGPLWNAEEWWISGPR